MELIKQIVHEGGCLSVSGRYGTQDLERIAQFSIYDWCTCFILNCSQHKKSMVEQISIEMIKDLVSKGSTITEKDLDAAIRNKFFLIAKYLINAGCSIEGTETVRPAIFSSSYHDITFEFSEADEEFFDFLVAKGANVHKTLNNMNLLEFELNVSKVIWVFVEKLLRLGLKPPRRVHNDKYMPLLLTQIKLQNEKILLEASKHSDLMTGFADIL